VSVSRLEERQYAADQGVSLLVMEKNFFDITLNLSWATTAK
jgi:hypothetical protein